MRMIDADKLKNKLNFVYDCAYIENKSKEGIASDIIDEIDNAPTVHHPNCDNCEDKAKQYTLGFQDGYDYGYNFKCSGCGKQVVDKTNFCPNCGVAMQNGGKEE